MKKGEADKILSNMPELLDKLLANPLLNRDQLYLNSLPKKDIPKQGIYVFFKNGKYLYVGRSGSKNTDLRERILQHGHNNPTATPLASKLAKEKATSDDSEWRKIYEEQLELVQNMQVRVVEVTDDYEQAMFEIYAAHVLNTPYNWWENH